jgi:hypothetical protein
MEVPMMRRSSALLGLPLLVFGITGGKPAAAYDGREHETLSTLSLELALEMRETRLGEQRRQLRALLLECRECAVDPRLGTLRAIPFGRLASSPDVLFHPEWMVRADGQSGAPDPKRCGDPQLDSLSKDFIPSFDRDLEVYRTTSARLRARLRPSLHRVIAVHRNIAHFEACAADEYNRLHGLAMTRAAARRGREELGLLVPLLTEALALHFLQDSFPPGHLLTPRTNASDIVARGMHQYNNRQGAEVSVAPDSSVLRDILAALEKTVAGRRLLDEIAVSPEEIAAFRSEMPAAVTFHGDGALPSRKRPRIGAGGARAELLLMVAVTTRSILDVLDAGLPAEPAEEAPAGRTRLAFSPWRAKRNANYKSSLAVDKETLRRPALKLQWESEQILGYPDERSSDLDRFGGFLYEISGSILYSEGDPDHPGRRVELGLLSGGPGQGDIEILGDEGDRMPQLFPDRFRQGLAFSFLGSYETWANYEDYGVSILVLPVVARTSRMHANFYLGAELGEKLYLAENVHEYRTFWGGRAGLGLGVLFLDFGMERESRVTPTGKVERCRTYSLGVRAHLVH